MKKIQRWILEEILGKTSVHDACKEFVKQRGIVDNARPHVGKKFIRKFDLKDFFKSIDVRRVYGIFQELGYSKSLVIFTYVKSLAQRLTSIILCREKTIIESGYMGRYISFMQ